MSPCWLLAKAGGASLSALALLGALEGCRGESPEGAAAGGDTLASRPATGGVEPGPSLEGESAKPAADVGVVDSTLGETMTRPPPEERAAAYAACRDSVEASLPDPGRAYWPTVPDTMAPADVPGQYRIVAQVRPDSVSPGAPFICVVRKDADRWSVMRIQGGPSPPQ